MKFQTASSFCTGDKTTKIFDGFDMVFLERNFEKALLKCIEIRLETGIPLSYEKLSRATSIFVVCGILHLIGFLALIVVP